MFLTLTILCLVVGQSLQFGAMGPIGTIDLKKVTECSKTPGPLNIQMKKDSKGRKVFEAQLDLKEEFNDKWTFKVQVHAKLGTSVQKNAMVQEGGVCKYLEDNFPAGRKQVWDKAGVKDKCTIPPGKYMVKDIYETEKVFKAKAMPYGSFQLQFTLKNPKKNEICCFLLDLDHTSK